MSKEDEYRNFAADCLRISRSAASFDHRLRLLHMAEVWLNLANKVARSEWVADHPLVKKALGADRPKAL